MGVTDEQIRQHMARDRGTSIVEVTKELVDDAELEQHRGQKGLSMAGWRKDIHMAEQRRARAPTEDSWSVIQPSASRLIGKDGHRRGVQATVGRPAGRGGVRG